VHKNLPFARGGTLRFTLFGWDDHASGLTSEDGRGYYALDPQTDGGPAWELFRCCLVRTLMSYNGRPTSQGGADPRPDLAAGLPTVSADGLVWTFKLKRGIDYAPPFQHTEITAQDFIRAIQRGLSPSLRRNDAGTGFLPINAEIDYLYAPILGAKGYEEGATRTIAGLEAPDPHTLVIHLTDPTGDLSYRLAMPFTAPIPPSPTDPTAPLGAATGHSGGDGPFLVASGPYMIEGSNRMDFRKPPEQQVGASGYVYGISLTLVRNPSWVPSTDALRAAYPDRIEMTLDNGDGTVHEREASDLEAGRADIAYFDEGASQDDPLLKKYLGDPALRKRLFIYPADYLNWMTLNLAMPPFDDIHVRKAVNLILDKTAVAELNGGHVEGDPAGHLAFDSLEDDLLLNYDPYHSPGAQGDLAAAEAEMRRSGYDRNGDGRCDDPSCRSIQVWVGDFPYDADLFQVIRSGLARIGLVLTEKKIPVDEYFTATEDPQREPTLHLPLILDARGFKDFPSGSNFFGRSFGEGAFDTSLIGAAPQDLRRWGYQITSVPSVAARVRACEILVGNAQPRCWAELDQFLMEEVVPWVPLVVHNRQRFISDRVLSFGYDQFTTLPALDRIALRPRTEPAPRPTPSIGPIPPIPDGVYRFTVTAADFKRFRGAEDPDSLRENTGTVTITMRSGRYEQVMTGDHPFFAPISLGHYSGSGDTVRFTTDLPSFNVLTTPPIRWTFDGHRLHFTFLSCEGLHDPENPTFCQDVKVFYEAHPWEKVG
jgi:peptide/nickel transport system substrate-binding protein